MLEKELYAAMPELFGPGETVYEHSNLDIVYYVFNSTKTNQAVTYLYENQEGFTPNGFPGKVYAKSQINHMLENKEIVKLDAPILVKNGEAIIQKAPGTYCISRKAEKIKKTGVYKRRTWTAFRRSA